MAATSAWVACEEVFDCPCRWNCAAEDQAIDRCHRLGQNKEVITTKARPPPQHGISAYLPHILDTQQRLVIISRLGSHATACIWMSC